MTHSRSRDTLPQHDILVVLDPSDRLPDHGVGRSRKYSSGLAPL
jgi:hypothetical protein